MARTVEVGRAVLSSLTQDLELWLTTLITISPLQQSIDPQQLSSSNLLGLLSSGNVWVGGGNRMRIEFEFTLRGEQLPAQRLQELMHSIMSAPVWTQLSLNTSLSSDATFNDKVISINVGHCENGSSLEETKRHRVLCSVPPADVQPPEGIPRYHLQLVRFLMDVLEPRKRPLLKRAKTSPVEGKFSESRIDSDDGTDKDSESMLQDMVATACSNSVEKTGGISGTTTPPGKRKRRAQRALTAMRVNSVPVRSTLHSINSLKSPLEVANSKSISQAPPSLEWDEISHLVDGAMRLSIYGVSKASTGLKTKANAFTIGLADIAPALWRPGYLTALSQRASLIPTIGRSFIQIDGKRVRSVSLSEKIRIVTTPPITNAITDNKVVDLSTSDAGTSLIGGILWQRLQRSLLTRPSIPVQAFVADGTEEVFQSDAMNGPFTEAPEELLGLF